MQLPIPMHGWSGITLRTAGYGAAAAFCAVSLAANLRYGLSLGIDPLDKGIYAAASVAADVFKIGLPLLGHALWAKRHRLLTLVNLALWLACLGWSLSSAIGFALSSRAEAVAGRAAAVETRNGWEATVHRAEEQLSALGRRRPVAVIQAELAATSVPPHVWQRTKECTEVTLAESQTACTTVLRLRKELAAAEAAERLESNVVAGRTQLATLRVAGSSADPQAGALARLTSRDEATVRTALALFLAGLIEAGSALGFTLVTVATRTSPPLPAPTSAPRSSEVTRRRVGSPRLGSVNGANAVAAWTKLPASAPSNAPTSKEASCRRVDPPQLATAKDAIGRWALTRLAIDPTTEVPARAAYEDFCCWSRAQGLEPCSETRFGVIFTAHIGGLGGRKVKRRDRAYYVGVSLAGACIPPALSRSEYTTSIKTERRVLGPCQVAAAQRRRWGRWCTKQRVEEQQVPK